MPRCKAHTALKKHVAPCMPCCKVHAMHRKHVVPCMPLLQGTRTAEEVYWCCKPCCEVHAIIGNTLAHANLAASHTQSGRSMLIPASLIAGHIHSSSSVFVAISLVTRQTEETKDCTFWCQSSHKPYTSCPEVLQGAYKAEDVCCSPHQDS